MGRHAGKLPEWDDGVRFYRTNNPVQVEFEKQVARLKGVEYQLPEETTMRPDSSESWEQETKRLGLRYGRH